MSDIPVPPKLTMGSNRQARPQAVNVVQAPQAPVVQLMESQAEDSKAPEADNKRKAKPDEDKTEELKQLEEVKAQTPMEDRCELI